MLWFDRNELQAYHPNTDGRCYCEYLLSPNDLTLQAHLPEVSSGDVFRITFATTDGTSSYAIPFTDHGVAIVAKDSAGGYYITLRLDDFPSQFCGPLDPSYEGYCFTIRLEVFQTRSGVTKTLFDKFSQPYCIADCCLADGELRAGTGNNQQILRDSNAFIASATVCGNPITRIQSFYDCFDAEGNYYGKPVTIISTLFNPDVTDVPFSKVTNLQALFKPMPADIQMTIARNCKVQKSEAANPWILQGIEPVPAWKMRDMEQQFRANRLIINFDEYTFDGGKAFEKIRNYQRDWRADYFRVEGNFSECRIWNIFGCVDNCGSLNTLRVFGVTGVLEIVKVYDDAGVAIANSEADWVVYLRSMDGVIAVTDVSYIYAPLGYTSAYLVDSTGSIPSYFYLNAVGEQNKIFGVEELPDLFTGCPGPVFGTLSDDSADCPPAVLGTLSDYPVVDTNEPVHQAQGQGWVVQPGGNADIYNNTVVLNFTAHNPGYGSSQAYEFIVSGDLIGWVGPLAAPAVDRTITEGLPADVTVIIAVDGSIRWFGPITNTPGYGEVVFANISYNL